MVGLGGGLFPMSEVPLYSTESERFIPSHFVAAFPR